jgi:hypothetical protein
MDSVYRTTGAGGGERPAGGSTADDRRVRLEGVARLGSAWVKRSAVTDSARGDLVRMSVLAEGLAGAADHSAAAMAMVQTLLCANCRRLNAADGKCRGQALDRCLLLNGINP